MELFSRRMSHLPILFISCFFGLCKAIDCGGNKVTQTLIVGKYGHDAFRTIQAAIDSVRSNNDQWVKIHIKAGLYQESVVIPISKPCIILEGEGTPKTIISHYDHQSINNHATLLSFPDNVLASGITFKNSYNVPTTKYKSYDVGSKIEPANAARLFGDKYFFHNCSFVGYQDTLYDHSGRHVFKDCYIQGYADFIYGNGRSYYTNCFINVVGRIPDLPGFVTANGRESADDPSGFVFEGGSIVGNCKVNLGRAWHPYSRVIFKNTYFSDIVTPQGWVAWSAAGNESRTTYAEIDCKGPGANTSKRVPWMKKLSSSDLNKFSFASFINSDGWVDNLHTLS
ncbi:putative pectinesterase 10 [Vigna radiata var. radiata]|uniref:pectinesterase n=1 Tax=Vigna radiata var. radiata TaxID=3916 RepID=A0A1S3UA61_VIGRR|nr:putative pectinesterase 10 [Vigna radiata var. radiata]